MPAISPKRKRGINLRAAAAHACALLYLDHEDDALYELRQIVGRNALKNAYGIVRNELAANDDYRVI